MLMLSSHIFCFVACDDLLFSDKNNVCAFVEKMYLTLILG